MFGSVSTITGMTKYFQRSSHGAFAWPVLSTSSQPSSTPSQSCSSSASQKFGIARPMNEPIVTELSIAEYWRAVREFYAPFAPDMAFFRTDPYDNQTGEAEYEDGPLLHDDCARSQVMLDWKKIV